MSPDADSTSADVPSPSVGSAPTGSLGTEAIDLVTRWIDAAQATETAADRAMTGPLQELIEDPDGVAFTMAFVDRVARPDDDRVAAHQLAALIDDGALPGYLGAIDRFLLQVGAVVAPRLPRLVMPLARRRMRQLVGHLVVDAEPKPLARHLSERREQGFAQNVNLLGEAVLGETEADRRLQATLDLIDQPDVDYVSVKLSAVASQLNYWDWDGSIERVTARLRTIFARAAATTPATFVNLDMEEYHDLELTMDAFMAVLDEAPFRSLDAGIVLQCYLPDSFPALQEIVAWANRRKAGVDGEPGGKIKVRLVKGANLAMERVEAEVHGWEQAPYDTKLDVDANYKRCIDWVFTKERTEAVRIGVASHNLFDVAWAHVLSDRRGVADRVEFEMLQGMAPAQARQVKGASGGLLLYTPVVRPSDFDVAISYLFRRLEENSADGNFMRSLFSLRPGSPSFDAEAERFRQALALGLDVHGLGEGGTLLAGSRRRQQRPALAASSSDSAHGGHFINEPDTDPALPDNRAWAAGVVADRPTAVTAPLTTSIDAIDAVVAAARQSQPAWWALGPNGRRDVLHAVADELARRRGDLITAMVHEANKTFEQADPEVSEAIDFARYYGDRAADLLSDADGEMFTSLGVIAVIPPWNFPTAIPAGGVLASLAAGNTVVFKPAPETPRCAEIVAECCWAAGVPADALQFVRTPDNEIGQRLVTSVDGVILTGSTETADLFRSWKPELRLFAETSGKNALIISPNADIDLAVKDLVASAFGHSGQKCSAASLAICIGPVARSERFRRQLVDAVIGLELGRTVDMATSMGPTVGPVSDRLRTALTTLDPGESWLVKPRLVDGSADGGELWSPGVRIGVEPGSWFHRTECFGPVLGVIEARDLDHAIAIANDSSFGLTGGLHSLDPGEVEYWLDRVEVGNAYVNRAITGAIVQRQPFGGWKQSSVGPGAKAGGPNYVRQLGTWSVEAETPTGDGSASDLATADASDAGWWDREFGVEHDPTGLRCEANVFRYRPLATVGLRVLADARPDDLARVRRAAARCGTRLVESDAAVEDGAAFARRLPSLGVERVRVVGGQPEEIVRRSANEANIHLADDPVTSNGRIELLHYLREQAISRTLHRFGNLVQAPPAS